MLMQMVAITEQQSEIIYEYKISEDITMYLSNTDNVASFFYGDVDFEVRMNSFVQNTINQLMDCKNEVDRIFLLQVLKSLELAVAL